MAISAYSTTAGSNTSVAGINIAEGCPAANINNGMRAMMADTRSFYEGATWTDLGHTPTRTGNTTFTINSDVTAYYIAGRRIRCTDSSTLYGVIASSSYSAPNTTVTVTLDSGNLSASLTAVAVSVIDPTGDPIGSASISGIGEFADNVLRVTGSSDSTKKVAFEVDGLTTATTRTLTLQDVSGTVYVSGGTDVPITDGGTGASTAADAFTNLKQAASDTATGVVELATAAEVATGSSSTLAVTPSTVKSSPAVAKAYYSGTISGGTLTDVVAYGCSVVRNSAGVFTVTLSPALADANYAVIPGGGTNGTQAIGYVDTATARTTTSFALNYRNPSTGTGTDIPMITFSVFGNS